MRIHKEGFTTLAFVLFFLLLFNAVSVYVFRSIPIIYYVNIVASLAFYIFMISFFRYPVRIPDFNDKYLFSPCDGKVVVIEETVETEYFNEPRLQVSIFMSPMNVHINWYPMSGVVKYAKYHAGKYLVAWHPKSSTDNERTTVVVENERKTQILLRQIAGAVAQRIVCYAKPDAKVKQGDEMGFIKFGSRVDIFLPLHTKINVALNQKVTGNKTIIAEI